MAKTFHLEIITPERPKYNDNVESVVVPGVEGQMGLLADHAPILALTDPGVITVRTPSRDLRMAVGQGFVKMSGNRAVCLVDFAENADEIDLDAARKGRTAVDKELATARSENDRRPLRMRLKEQLARLEVAERK